MKTTHNGQLVREAAETHICQGGFFWSHDRVYRTGTKKTWEECTDTQKERLKPCITKSRTAWMNESDPVAYRRRMDPAGIKV